MDITNRSTNIDTTEQSIIDSTSNLHKQTPTGNTTYSHGIQGYVKKGYERVAL